MMAVIFATDYSDLAAMKIQKIKNPPAISRVGFELS